MKAGILVTVCVFSHAALCSISLASPCPIGPPDSKGIRLIRQSPYFVSTFEAGPGGLLEHRIMERDGVRKEITSSYFHPLMVHKRIGAENTLEMRYADDGSALGDLKKIKVWGTTFDVFDRRGQISAGAFTITFKGEAASGWENAPTKSGSWRKGAILSASMNQ